MKSRQNILLGCVVCLGLCFFVFASGCAPVISKQLMTQAQRIGFDEIIKDPEAYTGKVAVLSGIILDSKNTKEGTLLEILQIPGDPSSRPKDVDKSKGRFLGLYKGFLDVAVYRRGREATIGGEITGKRVLPLGEIEYTYPFIEVKEIYLWPVEEKEPVYCYPPPYLWRPWWYYHYPWPCW
ncbi:MAG: Slp family lipoprotein [Deltaproteobacteria bacterium]|nr:Slp family lipoprotein [Deltaproteobacteria bacterium]